MQRNMKQWLEDLVRSPEKKPLPILSFPAVQLLGTTVEELIADGAAQARGMALVAQEVDAAASVSLMDLSVEAECFGAQIRVSPGEVPTVVGRLVSTFQEAQALAVPPVGAARSGLYIQAVRLAKEQIDDRPVLAGVIGPFSLAARLLDVSEALMACYDEPELVEAVVEKACQFLLSYCRAYKEAGADGVLLAEPVAGLLSPALVEEFSSPYVKRLVEAVQDDSFLVIYHNCGGSALPALPSILSTGAAAYHFGNAVDMEDILRQVPEDTVVLGNIDPAGEFLNGTPASIRAATLSLLDRCGGCPNFVLSSGCDIPPLAPWENIHAFFAAAAEHAQKRGS